MASHGPRRLPFRLRSGPMACRHGGSRRDLGGHGVGGRRGGSAEAGGHVGHMVGGDLCGRERLMPFTREAGVDEQSSDEQEPGARPSEKPPGFRDSRGRRSDGAVGRYPMRAIAFPMRRRIDVDLLQRLESLTLRPPDQILLGEDDSPRMAHRTAVQVNATDFAGPHAEITSEPAFRDDLSRGLLVGWPITSWADSTPDWPPAKDEVPPYPPFREGRIVHGFGARVEMTALDAHGANAFLISSAVMVFRCCGRSSTASSGHSRFQLSNNRRARLALSW